MQETPMGRRVESPDIEPFIRRLRVIHDELVYMRHAAQNKSSYWRAKVHGAEYHTLNAISVLRDAIQDE